MHNSRQEINFNLVEQAEKRFKECINVLKKKGNKYKDNKDDLGWYNKLRALTGDSLLKITRILMGKHLTVLVNITEHPEDFNIDIVKSVTGDIINYCIILEELYKRQIKED